MTIKSKHGRKFFIQTMKRGVFFVAADAVFSGIAAQIIVNDAMKNTGLKHSGTWSNVPDGEGNYLTGVGYRITWRDRLRGKSLWYVKRVLANYAEGE